MGGIETFEFIGIKRKRCPVCEEFYLGTEDQKTCNKFKCVLFSPKLRIRRRIKWVKRVRQKLKEKF